jgi:plastocyanin
MLGGGTSGIRRKPHSRSGAARMAARRPAATLRALPEGGTMSIRTSGLLVAAAAAVAVPAAPAAGAQTITISHETKGCHMWQLNDGNPKVNLSLTSRRGATLRLVNNDVMPHRLIQQAGPKLTLTHADMNRMSASMSVTFRRAGTYRFTTKAGDDYPWMKSMAKTIGPDNVLRLTVRVQ